MKKDYQYYEDLGVFDWTQLRQIEWGMENRVDVSIYADPKLDTDQMHEIRLGLKSGVDVSIYADTKFNYLQMYEIRLKLLQDEDPTEYLTKLTIETL